MNIPIENPAAFTPPAAIKPRELKVARQLARCAPGLGHVYAGDIVRGLFIMAAVDLPFVIGSLLILAPWGNPWVALPLGIISMVVAHWSIRDVRKVVLSTRADYRMKDYNHWAAYLIIGIVPTVAVAMGTAAALFSNVSRAYNAQVDLPAIGILNHDRFVEWRGAYRTQAPKTGDLIIYRTALSNGEDFLAQVAGLPGDSVTTAAGESAVPQGSLAVRRHEGAEGTKIVPETAVSGQLVFRFWPPQRFGAVKPGGEKH